VTRVPVDDPIELFSALFDRAAHECAEPDAMVLSTVDADGRPSARYVLLKGVDQRGFVFYTNVESRKARAMAANPFAALTFYWPPLTQVRIEGGVERVPDADADAYFATRPRGSQIGAWASDQSAELESPARSTCGSARSRSGSRTRRSRVRRSGSATASSLVRSSSGPETSTGSTTVSSSNATTVRGRARSSIPSP
jgi:pyridoxamine-phosphate oxidase